MSSFNNNDYESKISGTLGDLLYIKGLSNDSKIAILRRYAEIVVRKLLDIGAGTSMTLGDKKIVAELRKRSGNDDMLIGAVNCIRELGNKGTHTQEICPATDDDVDIAFSSLFDLYAYLFISYFKKYAFGSNPSVASAFSILPPIIRYVALKNLYEADCENIAVIDRLSLAILKAFGEGKAKEWLLERRDKLSGMKTVADDVVIKLREKYGSAYAQSIVDNAPANMFVLCMDRITEVGSMLEEKGRLYEDFEGALELFNREGRVDGDTSETSEFNSLMEFVYLGRKPKANDRLDNLDDYLKMT